MVPPRSRHHADAVAAAHAHHRGRGALLQPAAFCDVLRDPRAFAFLNIFLASGFWYCRVLVDATFAAQGEPSSRRPDLRLARREGLEPAARQHLRHVDFVVLLRGRLVRVVPLPGHHGQVRSREQRDSWVAGSRFRRRALVRSSRSASSCSVPPARRAPNVDALVRLLIANIVGKFAQGSSRPSAGSDE